MIKRLWGLTLLMSLCSNAAQLTEPLAVDYKKAVVTKGAAESIVNEIESVVIIPGESHETLWVHPELMTTPGDPVQIELRVRDTDRKGRDQHKAWNCFKTDADFKTLQPIPESTSSLWKRKDLSIDDFADSIDPKIKLPPMLGHTWCSAFAYLDSQTILQAFTTKNGKFYTTQSVAARIGKNGYVPLYISNGWTNEKSRGLYEPQISMCKGVCYMTGRAEDGRGYYMVSRDRGRSWSKPSPWKWDNGDEIPMNQTMTKMLSHSDGLVLVYTRIRDDNDNAFRNRSPLHIADFDVKTLSLKRSTERIIVPNRSKSGKGLPVGNFWVWPVNQQESFVVVTEWPRDGRKKNGDTWLSKIKWKRPNQQLTADGVERASLPAVK
ncbi:MAG: hypothetical protein PF904_18780 [Kiritimatiellae bacterium]|nr:hypothetical protein [Kiritimatiellia bacterium]